MTAAAMLAAARADLGLTGRPNRITRDYASRHGDAFLTAPWCDMSITHWARESGNANAVLPNGDRAFTVWHAQDGKDLGLGYAGTTGNIREHARPGAIVFFAWEGTDRLGDIDHVGLIERNLGDGRVQTIEGNTGDACKRRVRGPADIAFFWNPRYDDEPAVGRPAAARTWMEELVDSLPLLKKGAHGNAVKRMFYLLVSHGVPLDPKVLDATVMSDAVVKQLKAFQKAEKLTADGECGPKSWTALIKP